MTPNFDLISVELSRRVGHPVASANADADSLTASERTSYVNKALHKLFNDTWIAVKGNVTAFTSIFPELIAISSAITLTGGNYTIANPYLDFAKLIGCKLSTDKYVKVMPLEYWSTIETADNYQLNASIAADKPAVIQMNNILYFYPKNSLFTPILQYIKLPLNPTDGSFLTQGGTYDSPFLPHWNSKIASIAEELFLKDAQEST